MISSEVDRKVYLQSSSLYFCELIYLAPLDIDIVYALISSFFVGKEMK